MPEKKPSDILKNTLHFLTIIFIEGLVAAAWLLLIPKEAGNAVFLGYSLRRLALLVPIFGVAALAGLLYLSLKNRPGWQAALLDKVKLANLSRAGIAAGFLMALAAWSFAFFFHFLRLLDDMGAYVRLLPVITYVIAVGLEVVLFIALVWLGGRQKTYGAKLKSLFGKPFWIILGILVSIWLVIELTGLGKAPEFISIVSLGVPLLEGQVWYMAGLVVLILCLAGAWSRLPESARRGRKLNVDLLVCLVLWVLAAVLWLSLPLPNHNYFAPDRLPPNNSIYPFSDAEQYDMNSLWVWKGSIKDTVISKPLYVTFLALLHALVGLDYSKMILLQTLVLAILPAVLYLIGREMHSRLSGLVLALFAILREMNSIQAINTANVSNSKLLLSDLPATLLVCVLVLVMIRWIKSSDGRIGLRPFLIGGIIGCLNLMRIQTMLLEPFAILVFILHYRKNFRKILTAGAVFLLAVSLVLVPVLVRNHSITGTYWVDSPSTSSALYRFFLDASESELDIPQASSEEEMLDRNISVISQVLRQNLGNVVSMMLDNFMRNFISTLLIFPVRLGNGAGFQDFMQIHEPFWSDVYSQGNIWNALVIVFNLAIISIGVASTARKQMPALRLVTGFYLVYSLSSALVRLSGWRYIMPVDWLAMAFFAFGLIECLRQVCARWLGWNGFGEVDGLTVYNAQVAPVAFTWKPAAAYGLLFFLAGASVGIRADLIPADYPAYTRAEVCSAIQTALVGSEWEDQSAELNEFCLREDVRAYEGIGVYPRFFKQGTGFYKRNYDPFFGIQDYGRLVFRTVGAPNSKVYIKTDDADIHFPDGTPVYVVGTEKAKFEARVILIEGEKPQLIVSSGDFSEAAD